MNAAALALATTLVAGLIPPTSTPAPPGVQVGRPAPAFFVRSLDGRPIGLRALRGRPAFVNVFATWCAPCRQELRGIVAQYGRYHGRVAFLGVDEQEPEAKVAPFVRSMHMAYPVGIDAGQMAATYGASSIPHSVFIDEHGVVRAIASGPLNHSDLARDLALVAGAP